MNIPNSQHIPKTFPRQFDAHIYFESNEIEFIQELVKKAQVKFQGQEVFLGHPIDRPIGPHPLPMIEFNFPRSLFAEVTLWLMHERKHLSVLIHEISDDDYADHTQGALWLGKEVPLKLETLRS